MKKHFECAFLLCFTLASAFAARGQQEGPVPTQALVNVDAKSTPPANASALTVSINDHKEPLTAWEPVVPVNAQVALLIDDGLRESVGRELDNLRKFILSLPPGVEALVGFMQHGSVVSNQPFTSDHALAASTLRLPEGMAGVSASPYVCLSDFVKHWPDTGASSVGGFNGSPRKARFVLMLSDGVDLYNGSTSVMNQNSPYVTAAVTDSQRAGVVVYTLYYGAAGIHGSSADNSGQNYLGQLTQGTGGANLWEGTGNPVSMAPFLEQFQHAIAETYIATFDAPVGKNAQRDLLRVKFSAAKTKLHAPEEVRAGNKE